MPIREHFSLKILFDYKEWIENQQNFRKVIRERDRNMSYFEKGETEKGTGEEGGLRELMREKYYF